ncbi:MAG: hypothetical protein KDA85_13660, partial [Planctomycetaceae bacterium]|nr:hypothetical protein [Planctomycetaceae bacterium]
FFEDLPAASYRIRELQPSGVTDGEEQLGSLGGTVVANDVMQLSVLDEDAAHYNFAEHGQQVTSGDTASIGFWQNRHGQELIASGGTQLADWLTATFDHILGNALAGSSGADVAAFYKNELFKQKGAKSSGPAKVDAEFMAVALATFFTSRNLAGEIAVQYGFTVTDTGIATKIVNVGADGAAFGVNDDTNLTILQLLLATNEMTDVCNQQLGFAAIYDQDGNGVIDATESALRTSAHRVFSSING